MKSVVSRRNPPRESPSFRFLQVGVDAKFHYQRKPKRCFSAASSEPLR